MPAAKSLWSPSAMIGANPDVARVLGHGQVSANAGSVECAPAAVEGRQLDRSGSLAVPGFPVSSALMIHS